jgi:SAM-dependent methyltransferase
LTHENSTLRTITSSIGASAFWNPPRVDQPELLDQGAGTLDDVRANLNEMWQINQTFAGLRSLTGALIPDLLRKTQPVRIVDLGTGSGKLAQYLTEWAQQYTLEICVYPLDLSARHLSIAQETIHAIPNIHPLQANVLELPFAPHSIDYFVSSLFLHHFHPDALITLLRETYRLARRGIIMNDLVRGFLPQIAFRLVQPILARHYLTRHDGLISIKRAYTPPELLALAHAAGLTQAHIVCHFPWRMTLIAEKPDV